MRRINPAWKVACGYVSGLAVAGPGEDFVDFAGVEDLGGGDPGAARDGDAVGKPGEVVHGVGVAIDGEGDPGVGGFAGALVGQVEAIGSGVYLQRGARRGGGGEDGVPVIVGPGATADDAARGVGDDIHMRVVDGGEEAFGDGLAVAAQACVERGDHEVEFGQD